MSEVDYQMALLLQHRFEQEHKSSRKKEKSDYELAKALQEQFEHEASAESPSTSLVYYQKKTEHNSSKCLTDPSWELVDPTPDIHNLFIVFNQRFFWNKLVTVCVSWSKRMTSCAGVCSYSGRGGMCSITLSEPLLKLRPRKDLVETLLHEMIHAFLFVTHNNKDRDGHGPEFHKHMYRINKESGTNITVYHNFHDEVRLYQQHWWRCNGPCQYNKPYFGMVRRATNRAPGPNDRWWGEHARTCNGTFVKVKEPEKKEKPQKKQVPKGADIRKFIPVVDNVKGFKDLTNNKVKGKYNSTSTIVVTKTKTATNNNSDSTFKPTVFNDNGSKGKTEKIGGEKGSHTDDFLSVRNHWANKFPSTNKRPASSDSPQSSPKVPKPSTSSTSDDTECPVCNRKLPMVDLNSHLDTCLNQSSSGELEESKECPLCNSKIKSSSFDCHVEACIMKIYDGVEGACGTSSSSNSEEKVPCLACGKTIVKDDLNSHLDDCMNDIFEVDFDVKEDKENNPELNCPFCMKLVREEVMKEHIDGCLGADNDFVLESLMSNDL